MSDNKSKLEACFDLWVLPLLPVKPVEQYRFHPTRKWRFDYAYPEQHLAIEVDGGQYTPRGGRHNTDGDREKLNAAAALGWRILRYSGAMLKDPQRVAAEIEAARTVAQ
jgi:very-short-patch-repair endonuclease